MSFFQCDTSNLPPKQSEPSIPLILRGKKKASDKKSVSPKLIIKPPSISISNNNRQNHHTPRQSNFYQKSPIIYHQPQIQASSHLYHISPSIIRSITVQRPVSSIQRVDPSLVIRTHPSTFAVRPTSVQRQTQAGSFHQVEPFNIRKKLDENLGHVFKSLHEKRLSFNGPIKIDANNFLEGPKLQKKLVQQYIKLVYREYSIPDPLAEYGPYLKQEETQRFEGKINRISVQESVATEPNRHRTGKKKTQAMMSNSTNKKAVQLKQSFLIQMFSPADPSPNSAQPSNSSHQGKKYENRKGQKQTVTSYFQQDRKLSSIEHSDEREVKECYRYCFVCEEQILEANIQVHERQKCPQFSNLYQMSFSQLRICLIKKIQRIRHQTQQIHKLLFEKSGAELKNHIQLLEKQSQIFLQAIDQNIGIERNKNRPVSDQFWKCLLKKNFNNVMHCYQTEYFKMFEYCRKLQWFVVMLRNLEEKYYGKAEFFPGHSGQLRKHTRQTESFSNRRFSLIK